MTTTQQPEKENNPPTPPITPLAIVGIITIISCLGYSAFMVLAILQGETTPLYETDNPLTYNIHHAARWIMIGIMLAAAGINYAEAQRQYQSRNEPPSRTDRQTRKRRLIRNALQACSAIATIPVGYLAFKLISALIQGGTLGETAMPTELENQALNLLTLVAAAAALSAYVLDRIVSGYRAIRHAD